MIDPHIRFPEDPAPYMPGTLKRFRWPRREALGDIRRLRDGVQEEGKGLFILRAPYWHDHLLVEAYYPEDIRSHYTDWLDPYRMDDFRRGRLVVVKVHEKLKDPKGRLTTDNVREIRKNNRNARAHLKRNAAASYRRAEMARRMDEKEQEVFDRWTAFYENAMADTRNLGMKVRSGPARTSNMDIHI